MCHEHRVTIPIFVLFLLDKSWPVVMSGSKFIQYVTSFLCWPKKLCFKSIELAIIEDIPTSDFNQITQELTSQGWKIVSTYVGIDAWIDYGYFKLKKDGVTLTLEWDNWTEGSIKGPVTFIKNFAQEHRLKFTEK